MAKKPKPRYLRIEKVKNAKKESRPSRIIKKPEVLKKAGSPILGRMKGTVHYETDLTKPIKEKWDADF